MKRFLKILAAIVVVIIALLIILPYAFSDKIEQVVKEEINKMVDAKVDYSDFSLSIFSSFPDLRAGLEGVSVVGNGRFEGDTLAYIGEFSADIKILPLLDGDVAINAIIVNSPIVRGIVTADSIANWDIYHAEPDTVAEEETDTTSTTLKIDMRKVLITDADIKYIDSTMNLAAHISNLDLDLSGTMQGDVMNTTLALDVAAINVEMENIKYLKNANVDFDAQIEADLGINKYTFRENTLAFSGIPLAFDGYVQLKDSATLVDLRLAANETNFKTLLALIPEYIMKDVEGLRMDGTFELYADVDGEYVDMEHIPAIDAAFKVNNGVVKYPDLPKSLDDINIDVVVKNPGGAADLTCVDVNKMHFALAGNPFDAYLNLTKPMSNPTFSAGIDGTIDLNSLKDALPLDSMTVGGIVKANLKVATNMAAIDKEQYEDMKAEGTVNLSDFTFESTDLPQGVNVSEAKLIFTPKYLQLDPLKATVGKSDFNASGRVESYLPYVLSDGTIKGSLSLKSQLIDCNELMGNSTTTATADTATTATTMAEEAAVVEVPKNIDFALSTDIKEILYDKLIITNINGGVQVKDGVAKLNNLKLNMCEGSATLTGAYNTQNLNKPFIDMDIALNNVEVNALTNSFSTIDSLLPIAKSAHGKVSIGMSLVSDIDEQMSPIIKTMNGKGSFKSEQLSLKGSDFQTKLTKVLGNDKYNNMTMKSFKGSFTLSDGNLVLTPFNINMFDKVATFSGKQGLDKTMDYLMSIPISRSEIASLVGKTGLSIPTSGADVPVGINIGGTLSNPQLSLNTDALKSVVADEVKEKVTEKVNEVVDKAKEKVTEELKNNENVQKAAESVKNSLGNLFKKKK